MKWKPSVASFLIFACCACNIPSPKDKLSTSDSVRAKTDTTTSIQNIKANLSEKSRQKPSLFDSNKGYTLSFEKDSLEQRLKLVRRGKDSMDFCLILTNTIKHISDTISGGLMYVDSGGEESEVADDGAGFFYDNWNYSNENGCQINFTIDIDSVRYVHLYDYGCAKKLKTPIPVETKHYLKRERVQ